MVAYSEREKLLYVNLDFRGPTIADVEHPGWVVECGRGRASPIFGEYKTTLLVDAEERQLVFCELFLRQQGEEPRPITVTVNGLPAYKLLPQEGKKVEL